jgi:16S rRNA (guanine527-N7)-methyltransferase
MGTEGVLLLEKYFPDLDTVARERYGKLGGFYAEWNEKINLISRKDIGHIYERHILHSLAIARFVRFRPHTTVLDIGTGGGFPGIPLAIMFPEVSFTLVDSISKKLMVVDELVKALELKNVKTINSRAEQLKGSWEYVVSRATAPLGDLYRWTFARISKIQRNAVPNGIICLKGGDLTEEIRPYKARTEVIDIQDYFPEPFFETKKIVFLIC